MSDKGPEVKKRIYTRLMDVYRHNDIYIPGFNFVARAMLKAKAETAYSQLSSQNEALTAEVQAWLKSKNVFFGYGVFRSGTTFLADFLNRNVKKAVIQHEANVNDYWYYAKAIQSDQNAEDYIKHYRLSEIYLRTKSLDFETYGEINPFLRRHCAAMKKALPEAKQFHIVRDPKNVLRSLMSRELFDRKDPMGKVIKPHPSDPFHHKWPEMTRFEKLCWLWEEDNRFIRQHVPHSMKFELLRKDFDYFKDKVLSYLELEMNADDWHSEIGKVFNSTPKYTFPKYADWSTEYKKTFETICAEEMSHYGY